MLDGISQLDLPAFQACLNNYMTPEPYPAGPPAAMMATWDSCR